MIDSYFEVLKELSHDDISEVYSATMDVGIPDEEGEYLLNEACALSQIENVEFFISKGADVNKVNEFGISPLLNSIEAGNYQIASLLISLGADVNILDDCGYTPLLKSIECCRIDIVSLLLASNADIEGRGRMDQTPFLMACSYGVLDLIKLLVKSGCNIHATSSDYGEKDTAFDNAQTIEIKKYLIGLGVGV
ncbi:MAG: ankyrin repeat domain-containing protein [Alteromonadales bacterium]|nr:ankyrin repeat domain-containing protein [Alteromonadales bacterium]